MRFCTALLLAAIAMPAFASTDQPTDAELNDWMTYLRSTSLLVTVDVCTPLLGADADYAGVAQQWLLSHDAAITKGRDFAKAGAPAGHDFDADSAAMVEDFRRKLGAKPEAERRQICTESYDTLRKGTTSTK